MLIVGCPVSHRAWVLPRWFGHVERAAERASMSVEYLFVVSPSDGESLGSIEAAGLLSRVVSYSDGRTVDRRDWDVDRYQQMVEIRNVLLANVRAIGPELFLSLDSDILLHPDALTNLVETSARFDAVGGKTYMTPRGRSCPSWGVPTHGGGLRRDDAAGVFPMDIIMAIKLMRPAAYLVDYEHHSHGEDLGWSAACRRQGLRLGVDARVVNKHVMSRDMLDEIDQRCGF